MNFLSPRTLTATGLIFLCIATTGTALAAESCGGGYIKSVVVNKPAFRDAGIIGITVLHDDGTTKNYYSYQFGDIRNSAEIRSLLQLATTAYVSQSHVQVSVSQKCSYTYKESDGLTWVTRWNGLWLDSK
ncbi:hypothetical protein [Pseudomonas turukhanskensis]|uniref:Uncharacterized protein n=1 Tax=Pseudomonas turukhanskensis TaxID=1806536 RepID=A0A9W6KCP4_9PSED|nr:hypothetical protein [Pseudomonas turukhanskensis]GLK92249.1 hypothetical protein GCM10017655_53140 [Pseudomonas turukhanskensis]